MPPITGILKFTSVGDALVYRGRRGRRHHAQLLSASYFDWRFALEGPVRMLHSRLPNDDALLWRANCAGRIRPTLLFRSGRPKKGLSKFQFAFDDAVYWFEFADHRARFAADPERYAPQYGAYCAVALAGGEKVEADPHAWSISNGKLYVFGSKEGVTEFNKDRAGIVSKRVQIGKRCTYPNEHSRPIKDRPLSRRGESRSCGFLN